MGNRSQLCLLAEFVYGRVGMAFVILVVTERQTTSELALCRAEG